MLDTVIVDRYYGVTRKSRYIARCNYKYRNRITKSTVKVICGPETQVKEKITKEGVTARSQDFNQWYLDVIREADLADYGPVRGTMVIKPYGYAIWEAIQKYLDDKFKETGHENAYFPQLIPLSFLQKEADHVEGFAPELALVTKGGGSDLGEPLVVRPTSETIINHMFSQWIQSYRDLPMKLNQWCNVHRWELRTRPFIRTLEFLWQEGHTVHQTAAEAEEEAMQMIRVYEEFAVNVAALPVIAGRKSRLESFAGANRTYTIETMTGDRKALQAGTSHNLGTNFAEAFGTTYQDEEGVEQFVHQTSWGVSTRMVGGIIMTHGDDKGLMLPPKIAPIQVVIVPIIKKEKDTESVMGVVQQLQDTCKRAGIRVKVDDSTGKTPGFKFNYWEMKGVPIRVEVGPKDVDQNACVVARRDKPGKEGKTFGVTIEPEGFLSFVNTALDQIHISLLQSARDFQETNIVEVQNYEELKEAIGGGKWVRCWWSGSDEEEQQIKAETGATLRCYPFDQPGGSNQSLLNGSFFKIDN
eukprot:TRINITY_DN30203_c0_g3_i3.p1 TRINITY_DN30203_c0_g3~~TRINITY_DN30203_c0_g3_i3.p1  ORF type:complete len:527 (-),score=66.77 TRINITY_DN30203_c0_g3_i3:960-2540(-)